MIEKPILSAEVGDLVRVTLSEFTGLKRTFNAETALYLAVELQEDKKFFMKRLSSNSDRFPITMTMDFALIKNEPNRPKVEILT